MVRPLAGQSCDAGTVCNARKRFSSIDSAAEHVGKQIDGSGSCRASVGKGGISGDCGASQRVCAGTQPVALITSANSISSCGSGLFLGIITGNLHGGHAPPFFISDGLDGGNSSLGLGI